MLMFLSLSESAQIYVFPLL